MCVFFFSFVMIMVNVLLVISKFGLGLLLLVVAGSR